MHDHPEEQWGLCLEGSGIRFQGGEEVAFSIGDFWRTPGGVPHTMRAGEDGCRVLDIFAPPRDEYRKLAILVAWRGKDIENPAAILAGAHRVRHAAGRAPEIAYREGDLLTALKTDAGAFEAQAPLLFGVVVHASLCARCNRDDRNHRLVTGVDMRRQPVGKLPDNGVAAVIDIVKLGMLGHEMRVPLAMGQGGRAGGLTVPASLSYCRGSRQGDAASGMISTRRPACRPCALPQTPRALLWWTPRSAAPDNPAACVSSG